MNKIRKSLYYINWRLFVSLMIMGLCPAIYTTVRVFLIGQLPGEWSFSIAGQLSWVNLLYEIIDEAIILPLYFFMGKVVHDKKEYTNRIKSGLCLSLSLYTILSVFVIIFAEPLLTLMATNKDILHESIVYIRIESIANIFALLMAFLLICLITLGKEKLVYILTGAKLILNIFSDIFFVSTLKISANLGINGIGYSNILVNAILAGISIYLLHKEGIIVLSKGNLSFNWIKDFLKIGGISGLESLIRNAAYMIMICRMVNVVNEQGTYWVANNFMWG